MKLLDVLVSVIGISLLAYFGRSLLPDDFNVMPRYQYVLTSRDGIDVITIENINVSPDQVRLVWTWTQTLQDKRPYREVTIKTLKQCQVIDQNNWTCPLWARKYIRMLDGKLESTIHDDKLERADQKLKLFGAVLPL